MRPVEMNPTPNHGTDNHQTTTASRENPRKRVARACDRCRLKKGKCDGREQCQKCVASDIMCIYTDRKPPQQKQMTPGFAEALQSENLTLKKAVIILYRNLVALRGTSLPDIDGVDWHSDKVAGGKSGRALNYIITQEARVDNRISNDEINDYDPENASLDSSSISSASDSPPNSSPAKATFETVTLEDPLTKKRKLSSYQPQQQQQQQQQQQHRRRLSHQQPQPQLEPQLEPQPQPQPQSQPQPQPQLQPQPQPQLRVGFIEPSMLACPATTQSAPMGSLYPPTPPTNDDLWPSPEVLQFQQNFYMPTPQQWSAQPQQQQQQQQEFYDDQFLGNSSIDGNNPGNRQEFDCFV